MTALANRPSAARAPHRLRIELPARIGEAADSAFLLLWMARSAAGYGDLLATIAAAPARARPLRGPRRASA